MVFAGWSVDTFLICSVVLNKQILKNKVGYIIVMISIISIFADRLK